MIIPLDSMLVFSAASILLALAPGPDNIFVLMQTFLYGRKEGFLIIAGLCTGLLFHTLLVVVGVAMLLKTSLLAFTILKFMGAGYLLYLAWLSFFASPQTLGEEAKTEHSSLLFYRRGIIMNVTNPKVGLFFMAYLPQFVNPANGSVNLQMLLLSLIFIASTFIVFGLIVLMSNYIRNCFIQSEAKQKMISRLSSVVFILLALNLLLT